MLHLTRDAWQRFAPKCPDAWTAALFNNLALLRDAGVLENERRWCHFAATVYHETNGFRDLRENLNYRTAGALRKAWPSRFGHKTDSELAGLLRNPSGLADQVYGCYSKRKAIEVGDLLPGEAHAWRGGGWVHTTFKPTVERYCAALGVAPVPGDALDDPVLTLRFAILEWTETGCNALADENQIRKVAKAINTGSADSGVEPNGMDGRKAAFARAWSIWGEYGQAEVPATPLTAGKVVTAVGTVATGTEVTRRVVDAVMPAAPAAPPAPPPGVDLAAAKKAAEHASDIKAVGSTFLEFVGFIGDHPYAAGGVFAVVAGVWFVPKIIQAIKRHL